MLEKLFHLSENETTVRREIIGGMTTFLTLSYIIFVQPALLSDPHGAEMDFGAVMTATCLSSALAIFLMAFLANYPIALAPGMGHNVFFSFIVCGAMGIPWQTAMGAILISGSLFVILGAFGFRKAIMDCIPPALKFGIAVGIGLMIALLGLEWAGLVINSEATLVTVATDLNAPHILVSGAGLLVIMILSCYNVRGSVLLGMIVSGVLAWWFGLIVYDGAFAMPPSLAPTFFQLDPIAAFSTGFLTIIFIFFILDLFDTIATLVGVAELGGFMKGDELPRARQALLSDAIGTVGGACLGTSTVTSYVESCAGISDGARTGLANVVTGLLFLAALFTEPLVRLLGKGLPAETGGLVYPIIAPALIVVGFLMMRAVKLIPWDDYTESIPAFISIVFIAFSFSPTEGIAFGFISYTILKLTTGRVRDVHPLMWIISLVFIFRYFYLAM